jgi:hypothetical protein
MSALVPLSSWARGGDVSATMHSGSVPAQSDVSHERCCVRPCTNAATVAATAALLLCAARRSWTPRRAPPLSPSTDARTTQRTSVWACAMVQATLVGVRGGVMAPALGVVRVCAESLLRRRCGGSSAGRDRICDSCECASDTHTCHIGSKSGNTILVSTLVYM